MINSFKLSDSLNLFGSEKEVKLTVTSPYASFSGLVISQRQLDHAAEHVGEYRAKLLALNVDPNLLERHIATILNPPKLAIAIAPDGAGNPNELFVQLGSSSKVAFAPWRMRLKGEPFNAELYYSQLGALISSFRSRLGFTPAVSPVLAGNAQWLAFLQGMSQLIAYYAVSSTGSGSPTTASYHMDSVIPCHHYPGFTTFAAKNISSGNPPNNNRQTFFTGLPLHILSANGTPLTGDQFYAASRTNYLTKVGSFGDPLLLMHQIWQDPADPRYPELAMESSEAVGALLTALNNDGVSGGQDFTFGTPLYYIGSGANLEFLRALCSSFAINATDSGVYISAISNNIQGSESNDQSASRFRDYPLLLTDAERLSGSGDGTIFRIAEPFSMEGVRLRNTKMWAYLDRAHDLYPDYVPSPESTKYAMFTEKGVQKIITLGNLDSFVPRVLAEKPYMKSISVVANNIGKAAVRDKPWELYLKSPTLYKIGIQKFSCGLYNTSNILVKTIVRANIPYLASHGIPLWFPNAAATDLNLKFTEADFRQEVGVPTDTFSNAFADFKMSVAVSQEEDLQMCLANWVAEDGGVPNPAPRLLTNFDEGIRYVHALHARDRSQLIGRIRAAIGFYSSTLDETPEDVLVE